MAGLTDLVLPLILLIPVLDGVRKRRDVYGLLVRGGRSGVTLLLTLFPTLVFLLTGVEMLRASGALDALTAALGPAAELIGVPAQTLPLIVVRPVSGSAALAVGAELMTVYGPDSPVGRTAAIMLGSTETTFYTISVYFGAAGVRKTRYAIPAALIADLTGFAAAAFFARLFPGV